MSLSLAPSAVETAQDSSPGGLGAGVGGRAVFVGRASPRRPSARRQIAHPCKIQATWQYDTLGHQVGCTPNATKTARKPDSTRSSRKAEQHMGSKGARKGALQRCPKAAWPQSEWWVLPPNQPAYGDNRQRPNFTLREASVSSALRIRRRMQKRHARRDRRRPAASGAHSPESGPQAPQRTTPTTMTLLIRPSRGVTPPAKSSRECS